MLIVELGYFRNNWPGWQDKGETGEFDWDDDTECTVHSDYTVTIEYGPTIITESDVDKEWIKFIDDLNSREELYV